MSGKKDFFILFLLLSIFLYFSCDLATRDNPNDPLAGNYSGPEITVKMNGTALNSGETKYMGSIDAGATGTAKTFTITNDGTKDLRISMVSISDPVNYTIDSSSVLNVLQPGLSTEFTIQFTPGSSSAGVHNAQVTISNSDSNEGNFVIPIVGHAKVNIKIDYTYSTNNGEAKAIIHDSSGNIYMFDSLSLGLYVKKYSSTGVYSTAWSNTTGQFNYIWHNNIAIDGDDNIYVANFTNNNIGNNNSKADWIIVKYDTSGNKLDFAPTGTPTCWGTSPCTLDGNDLVYYSMEYDYNPSIVVDSDGYVYVAGFFYNPGIFTQQVKIIKFASNGAEVWTQAYNFPTGKTFGDSYYKAALALDSNNNIYIAYTINSNVVGTTTEFDCYIMKLDSSGDKLDFAPTGTSTCGSGTSPCTVDGEDLVFDGNTSNNVDDNDYVLGIMVDASNNLYVYGYGNNIYSNTSGADGFIKKFNSSGTEITTQNGESWAKVFPGLIDIQVAAPGKNNSIIVAGSTESSSSPWANWFITKYSNSGVEDTDNWNLSIDGNLSNDYVRDITITADNIVYAAGAGNNIVGSSSNADWWIMSFYDY